MASQTNPSAQKLTPTHALKLKSAALKAAQVDYKKSQEVEKTPQKNIISNRLILESKQSSNEPWKKGVEKVQKLKFTEPEQQKIDVKHRANLLNKLQNQRQGVPESARPQNPIYMIKDAPLLPCDDCYDSDDPSAKRSKKRERKAWASGKLTFLTRHHYYNFAVELLLTVISLLETYNLRECK